MSANPRDLVVEHDLDLPAESGMRVVGVTPTRDEFVEWLRALPTEAGPRRAVCWADLGIVPQPREA